MASSEDEETGTCDSQINRVSPRLHRVEAVLEHLRGGTNELGELPGQGKNTDNGLGLKADEGLILGIEWPLQAAEIQINSHRGSLSRLVREPSDPLLRP